MWNWYKWDDALDMPCHTLVILYDATKNQMQTAEMIGGYFYEYPAPMNLDGESYGQRSIHNEYQFWMYLPNSPM